MDVVPPTLSVAVALPELDDILWPTTMTTFEQVLYAEPTFVGIFGAALMHGEEISHARHAFEYTSENSTPSCSRLWQTGTTKIYDTVVVILSQHADNMWTYIYMPTQQTSYTCAYNCPAHIHTIASFSPAVLWLGFFGNYEVGLMKCCLGFFRSTKTYQKGGAVFRNCENGSL